MQALRRFGVAAAAVAAGVTGAAWVLDGNAGDAVAAAPPAFTVQQQPFLIRFAKLAQAPGRMTYVLADGSRHTLGAVVATAGDGRSTTYTVATDEPGRLALVTLTKNALGVRVSWRLEPAAGVAEVHESWVAPGQQHFLGSGQREAYVDLVGQAVPLKVSFECGTLLAAPYFASSAGYAVRLEGSATGQIMFKGAQAEEECKPWLRGQPLCRLQAVVTEIRLCLRARSLAYEVYTGSFRQNLDRFTARTGRPRAPAKRQFALVKWRDEVAHSDELLEDVTELQKRRIPLGWVLLDNPWEEGCFGTLAWDRRRIPDPAATIAAVRSKGVRFMLWVSPYVRCPPAGYEDGELFGERNPLAIDLTNARARALYEQRLRAVLALGVDGVKGDRGDERDLERAELAGGSGATLHNLYPSIFGRTVSDLLRAVRGADVATMFRAGWAGAQRHVPGFWAGDQDGSWDGLKAAIRAGQTAGVSGFPVWGSDVGGYRSEGLTPEVFVRWAQLGAISPILEVGGNGPHARFWDWGEPTVSAFRRAAVLHYELFPYLWELARRASRTGEPILRPLGWEFPGDSQAWRRDLQLLVGSSLLAAPVTRPGTSAPVYLPRGAWIDLWRGTKVHGPRALLRRTPLAELPLYLRAGSAIPFDFREPQVWGVPWRVDDLGRAGRAGWLLAPGAPAVTASAAAAGGLRALERGRRLDVTLTRSPRETQVLVAGPARPQRVLIGGKAVAAAPSLHGLRGRSSGWARVPGPIPGIVVKLGPGAPRTFSLLRS